MPESQVGVAGYAKLKDEYTLTPGYSQWGQDLAYADLHYREDESMNRILYDGHGYPGRCIARQYNEHLVSHLGILEDAFDFVSDIEYPAYSSGFVFAGHKFHGTSVEAVSVGDVSTYVWKNDTLIDQLVHNTTSIPVFAPILSEKFDLTLEDSEPTFNSPSNSQYGNVHPDGSFDLSKTMNSKPHCEYMWNVLSQRGQSMPLWEILKDVRPPNMNDLSCVQEYFIRSIPQMLYLRATEKDTHNQRQLCGPISSMEQTVERKIKPHTDLPPLVHNYTITDSPMIIIHASDGVTDAIDLNKFLPQIIRDNLDKPNSAQEISDAIIRITIDTLTGYRFIDPYGRNLFDDISILTDVITI